MSILSTLLHATNFRNPILRTLIPAVGTAYALQFAVAVPSIITQSERFYDFSGSITYLSVTALSLYLPTLRSQVAGGITQNLKSAVVDALTGKGTHGLNWRQATLSAAVAIWATRLGSYLFKRILDDGHDSRFDKIKKSPPMFMSAFMAQATWVSICLLPVIALNSIPHKLLSTLPLVKTTDILGLSLYVGGLTLEVMSDRQKSAWVQAKKRKEHDEEFLTSGLWSRSRHPNYFGETMLWTGIATTSAGVLAGRVGQLGMGFDGFFLGRLLGLGICMASPAFTAFLLLKVSGVPLSETKYDKRYGDRKDYQKWKRETPVFIPKLW